MPPSPSPLPKVSLDVSVLRAGLRALGNSMCSSHATDVVTVLLQGYSLSKVILMVLMAEGVSSSLYTQTHTSEEGP